jgi:hypothetical protein
VSSLSGSSVPSDNASGRPPRLASQVYRRAFAFFLPVAVLATLACGLVYVDWPGTFTGT